ncbi:BsuBI/PstI family type II restriction endonuclease [Methanothrix soehngenii]|uniref:BsuBI/PstI family type II restriction endonuclease n=1 Tax=Methanothrix soehngenii TaxID=2223 RepID=UPI002353470D|nr:BsuBI/PstI family type II restriction endonuclease [Methanothrix soehngenii]
MIESKAMLDVKACTDTLLDRADFLRIDATRKLNPTQKAEMGQFFTPSPVAKLMASMFTKKPQNLTILDPGAGVGSLSAALVAEICSWDDQKPKSITIAAYEIDPMLIDYLHTTIEEIARICDNEGIMFSGEVFSEDFMVAGIAMINGGLVPGDRRRFSTAILNPPYHKIRNNSKTKQLLKQVNIETTNLYTAFMWLVIKLLEPGGEMVAITPRSFCNGPYYRPFRKALFKAMKIKRVHVYESRKTAFQDDDVLQENIIIHAIKEKVDANDDKIVISSSIGPDDEYVTLREVDYDQFVRPGDPDFVIHIVPDEMAHRIGEQMGVLDSSLKDLNLIVSTGRVVDFRAKHLVRRSPSLGAVPLIYPAHFSNGFIRWPVEGLKKPDAIICENPDLLVPSGFYVLVKRFSSKEEEKRIVAAVFDPTKISSEVQAKHDISVKTEALVGFENHINYYHRSGKGMPMLLAKGLAAFLNSTLVDQYFRQFSGHTQVNATDLKSLKYPNETRLLSLGERIGENFPSQDELDLLVKEELGIAEEEMAIDPVKAGKKIKETVGILKALGLPKAQLNDRSALTLLALLDIKGGTPWRDASRPLLGITEMMNYFSEHFGVKYAPNTRETVRRQTVHQFIQAGLILVNPDNPSRPINSPDTRYQIEDNALNLIKSYDSPSWNSNLEIYLKTVKTLRRLQAKEREMALIPVKLPNGDELELTAGGQNVLIKQIIEELCPRYLPGGFVVYMDDAGRKNKEDALEYLKNNLGITIDRHGKMPDVIVHIPDKHWLILVEAVTSHGPIDIKRHNELKDLFHKPDLGLIFVTAFLDRQTMGRYLSEIAWETEVWVAEAPTHLIHFNGERFLGPY